MDRNIGNRINSALLTSIFSLGAMFSVAANAITTTVVGSGSTFQIIEGAGITAERRAVFVAAAQYWANILVSPVDITFNASFQGLSCNSSGAILGQAGPQFIDINFPNAPLPNVAYVPALANSLAGVDRMPNEADFYTFFNSYIDNNDGCLYGTNWYYGLDHNAPGNDIDFYETLLHEMAHGLGFFTMLDSNGGMYREYDYNLNDYVDYPDTYLTFLKDQSTNLLLTQMSQPQRAASVVNNGNLVWSGDNVNSLANQLSAGVNSGNVQLYAPYPYESGSSTAHFDQALYPNEVMEPQYNGDGTIEHTKALFQDLGWNIVGQNTPKITGQQTLTIDEESTLTLETSQLTYENIDATASLSADPGSNYSLDGQTLSPVVDFHGTLSIPIRISDSDDGETSEAYSLQVSVNNVNDQPEITAQAALSTAEDTALSLSTSVLSINDHNDGDSYTLSIATGDNYSVSGSSITPSANYSGELSVPVTVDDGQGLDNSESEVFNLAVSVIPGNQDPQLSSVNPITIDEDSQYTLKFSDIAFTDETDDTHTLHLGSGANFTTSATNLVPESDFFGTLSVPVWVSDNHGNASNTLLVPVTVLPINDAPLFTSQPPSTCTLDTLCEYLLSASDIDNSTLFFSISSGPEWLSLDGAVLSGPPSAIDVGEHGIVLSVSDGELEATQSFTLSVLAPSQSDLQLSLAAQYSSRDVGVSNSVSITVKNLGRNASAAATLEINWNGSAYAVDFDSNCESLSASQVRCVISELNAGDSASFWVDMSNTSAETNTLRASVGELPNDSNLSNNHGQVSLTFTDASVVQPTTSIPEFGHANTRAIAIGDITGNGWFELLFANGPGQASTAYGFGRNFSLQLVSSFGGATDSRGIALADFNQDGALDVVLANSSQQGNSVLQNTGNGSFSDVTALGTSDSYDVAVGDFNRDGLPDVVFANAHNQANTIYLNNGNGQFSRSAELGRFDSRAVAVIVDHRDGWPDILVANRNYYNLVYINQGPSPAANLPDTRSYSIVLLTTAVQAQPIGDKDDPSVDVLVADLDGDGIANEFIFANSAQSDDGESLANAPTSTQLYQVSATGQTSLLASLETGSASQLSTGDFDGDGQLDIAVMNDAGLTQVFSQNDAGDYQSIASIESSDGSALVLDDLDQDGQADLLIATASEISGNTLYLQPNESSKQEENEVAAENEGETTTESPEASNNNGGGLGGFALLLLTLLVIARYLVKSRSAAASSGEK